MGITKPRHLIHQMMGNVRDMWDWLLLVYYVSSLMCRVCLSIHVTEAFRYRFDQIWFDLSNYNGFWCNLLMKAWIKTRVSRKTNDQYDEWDNKLALRNPRWKLPRSQLLLSESCKFLPCAKFVAVIKAGILLVSPITNCFHLFKRFLPLS